MSKTNKAQKTEFVKYCLDFYGKGGLYAKYYSKPFTAKEIEAATELRIISNDFAGDTFDREAVRDLIIMARGKN